MTVKIKLVNARLAFPALWEAKQFNGEGPFRYDASFLIEPGSANDKIVWEAIESECVRVWDKKAKAMLESIRGNSNKFCYQSGDVKGHDGFVGMMVLSSHRKQEQGRPIVVDKNKDIHLLPADGKPYSGCYVNAYVDIWAQAGTHSGMRAGLLSVQFAGDGDAFSGGSQANADDFDDISEGSDSPTDFA